MPADRRRPLLIAAAVALTVPIVVVTLLLALVVPGVPWWLGLLGLLAGPVLVWWRWRRADAVVLAACGGRPGELGDHPRLANLFEELMLRTGIGEPDLVVVDTPSLNAAAVSGAGGDTAVVTTGLLESTDRMGLEAVVAELLVRFRDGDALAATEAEALLGWLWIPAAAPLVDWARRQALPADLDLTADQAAVGLTRYPPGLEATLRQASELGTSVPGNRLDRVWMWSPEAGAGRTPLDVRIDVLVEFS